MSGSLVTRATSDFDNLGESLTSGVLTSVVELFTLAGCVIGMFILSWQLGMIALFILPIVVAIVIYFSSRIKTNMLAARKKIATLNAFTQECLFASDSIKLLTAEDASNQRFRDLNKKYRDQQMKVVNYDAFLFSVLDGMSSITLGITLWFAISFMGETKPLDAGLIVAFVRYIQQLFEPLKQLGSTMAMLQGAFTAVDRIFGIMETEEFIEGNQEATLTRGSIQFKDVSFSYQASEKEPTAILRNISFALDPGQSLAIVGSTGSGKSTIIKILTKLYDHYQGSVQIDGIEIRDIEESLLRQEMAIVPQDIVLFDGSVMFNITLGNESISRDQAIEASKLVGLHQFITKFADGYDFLVKEQGSNLSQGQRQLIAFARALVRNPKIIILDEATSSIDPQAEIAIQGAMAKMMIGRSVIIIAHRLSTIEECDKILVLEQGTIVETGSHQALLAQAGPYHKLYAGLNLDSMIPSS
jgi:ATP-binding cassette subfamily B protein